MPTCPKCGGTQPDDVLLALHMERYCRARGAPEAPVGEAAAPDPGRRQSPLEPEPSLIPHDGVWHPALDRNFYLPGWVGAALDRLVKLSQDAPVNILLTGPSGSGKTSCARQLAAAYGRPFASIEFGKLQEPREVFGERLYSPERGTFYVRSLLWRAIETEGCVVLLDEINRAENPKVVNPLLALLDDRREAWVDELETRLVVAPRVIFAATINEGYESSGVDPLDTALRDRFHQVQMQFPTMETIVKILKAKVGLSPDMAGRLATVASSLRVLQLRSLLKAAMHLRLGASLGEAIRCSFVSLEPEQMEALLQAAQDTESGVSLDASEHVWPNTPNTEKR